MNEGRTTRPAKAATRNIVSKIPIQTPARLKIGFVLAKRLLQIVILAISIVFILFLFTNWQSQQRFKQLLESKGEVSTEIIQAYQDQAAENNEAVQNIAEMILINLLLPVLTALLGYMFGTAAKESDDS